MFRFLITFFYRMSKSLILSSVFFSLHCQAQETISPRLRALLLVPGGPVVSLHAIGGKTVGDAIAVGARGLSESFTAPGRNFSWAISDKKEESGYRSVGEVQLPEQGDDFIILLEPVNKIFKSHAIQAKESLFGADGLLFFNASDAVIGAALGNAKVKIPPRVAVFGKAPARADKPFYQVTFYYQHEGDVRPFYDTRWPHRDDSRCYIFFYRSENGRITYQSVDERLKSKDVEN
jgi:hypothetical protein